jgi:predicted nucleic acid-binding protein
VRALIDVNVCMDVLLERAPFAGAAARLWEAVERGEIEGLLPAHGVTTIHYLMAREKGGPAARRLVSDLLRVFGVAPVDKAVLDQALALEWKDFEDAVCAAAAETSGCDLLVTRDVKGFAPSVVPAVDPLTAVALLSGESPSGVSERSRPRGPKRKGRRRAHSPG